MLLGLLDTGATGIFVKRAALKNIEHEIKNINIQVKGRYALSHLKEIALFDIKLPDFYNSRTVSIRAYVEEEAVGRHDIILGIRFIQQLGLIFDFKRHAVVWDEITIPMRQMGSIKPEELTTIDNSDPDIPKSVQKAVRRLEQSITQNDYNTYNYRSMVLKCTHLNNNQQDTLLNLFRNYAPLFDGTLGKVPNVKVHLDLKPNAKPFCARAYKIPHHIFDIACKEVEELCRLGVLQADIHSEWGAPC